MNAILTTLWDSSREAFGRPASLQRMLAAYPHLRVDFGPPKSCINAESAVRWHEMGAYKPSQWPPREAGVLLGWRVTKDGYWQSFQITRPEYQQLGVLEVTPDWTCDISALHGFSSSKSDLDMFANTDEMVQTNSRELIADVSPEGLAKNLAHTEIRILHEAKPSDHFRRYMWDGRLWLINEGGSHHTAAAKYIAARLGARVPLKGKLCTFSLNPVAVDSLRHDFVMFVISDEPEISNAFHDAMRSFQVTYLYHSLPEPYAHARAILLPRDEPRSMKVAQALRDAGVVDLGKHLASLVARQAH